MARPLRPTFPGAVVPSHNLATLGKIFFTDDDRDLFWIRFRGNDELSSRLWER